LENIILLTDSYKLSHFKQYPPHTTKVYSYLESRGGKFKANVFFGLQAILKKYLVGKVVTQAHIDEADDFAKAHFGNTDCFNRDGWQYILDRYDGYLPIRIKAVQEGTVIPAHNALITVENTDPSCFWLTNHLETLLVQAWYPITVATQSWHMKQKILDYLNKTGDPSLIDFKLHDFGFRGVSSVETAGMGGMAHLVNFKGTDTIEGIMYANKYYDGGICGFSIPATEHSTITSWGRDKESEAYENLLKAYPTGLVACVSDSYNIYNACEKIWGEELRMEVLKRDGTLVIRPDSGNPPDVVVKILEILGTQFGASKNDKGFKVLNPKVRVIQGDGIDYEMIGTILEKMVANGWSADNIAFGSGGGLLQKLDRDTCKFAFKCSFAEVNGKPVFVYKDPVTDPGKKSKQGRMLVVRVGDGLVGRSYRTIDGVNRDDIHNELCKVYEDGVLIKDWTFDEVRDRVTETGRGVKEFERL
jgi:nicotinamide phosphoribosyltransferase